MAARERVAQLETELEADPARASTTDAQALVDKGIVQRQTAAHYLHDLAHPGVLSEMPFGKEKRFIRPKLIKQLFSRDSNLFQSYA